MANLTHEFCVMEDLNVSPWSFTRWYRASLLSAGPTVYLLKKSAHLEADMQVPLRHNAPVGVLSVHLEVIHGAKQLGVPAHPPQRLFASLQMRIHLEECRHIRCPHILPCAMARGAVCPAIQLCVSRACPLIWLGLGSGS